MDLTESRGGREKGWGEIKEQVNKEGRIKNYWMCEKGEGMQANIMIKGEMVMVVSAVSL